MEILELNNAIFGIKIHWVDLHQLELTEEGVSEPEDRSIEISILKK